MRHVKSLFGGEGNKTVEAALSAAESTAHKPTSPTEATEPPHQRPQSVVIVDFDNVMVMAGENGFPVSFTRLKSFLQKFGDIVLAFVFVPWKYRSEARVLSDAGFYVILCPPFYKDKDSVDVVLARMVQSIIVCLKKSIQQIVLVSRDADFNPLAALARDHGLLPINVDILTIREEVEGEDGAPQVYLAREGERFKRILRAYERDLSFEHEKSPLHISFLTDIVKIAGKCNESQHFTFAELQRYIANHLDPQWDYFKRTLLRSALSALKEVEAITRSEVAGSAYYTLNRESPIVKKLLQNK